jgi:hypothetical protein
MPGKKYRSIKAPYWYERMRAHGFSKEKAARISNWMKSKGFRRHRKKD